MVVYNGIGGKGENSKSHYNLYSRIRQEINSQSAGTGTLNLKGRVENYEDYRVSFFDFDINEDIINKYKLTYSEHAKILEQLWRLKYGMPNLNRH